MPRDIFRDVTDPSITVGTKQWYTVPLSIAAHAIIIGALVVIPLMASDVLPTPQSMLAFVAPSPPPPPPATPPPQPHPQQPTETPRADVVPLDAPPQIRAEEPARPDYSLARVDTSPFGVPGGTGRDITHIVPPTAPPPQAPEAPVRPGGHIKEPRKVQDAKPIYPQIAITAKVQGVVIIEATIAKDGSVKDARVLKSVPLLDLAALEAVRKWKFSPTLLNGVPVEVIMTVTVNFTLGGN
jgi:periplasmic protein TonB